MNCTAVQHGSTWAYNRYGCRCPHVVAHMRRIWRNRAARRPRGCGGNRDLTPAERETAVARMTAAKLSTAEIAERLRVTMRTVSRIRVRLREAA